jgi:hypothetical protein
LSRVSLLNQAWIPADIPSPGNVNISGVLTRVSLLNQAWIPADIPSPGNVTVNGVLTRISLLNQAWIPADIPSAGTIGFAASLRVSLNNTAISGNAQLTQLARVESPLETASPAQTSVRTAEILSPAERSPLLVGQTVPIRVSLPETGANTAEFLVNGIPWRSTAPFEFLFTVPAGVSSVDLQAIVRASDGREWVGPSRHFVVAADPGQTISGRVIGQDGRPIPGAQVHVTASGLAADYFRSDQPLAAWPDLTARKPDKQSYISAVNQPNTGGLFGHDPFGTGFTEDYASRFTGRIQAVTPGNYIFYLQAHRGSRLLIDGKLVIEIPFAPNDPLEGSGVTLLDAGWHSIEVDHFESVGAPSLELSWQRPDSVREVVPQQALQTDVRVSATTDGQGSFSIGPIPLIVAPLTVSTESSGATVVLNGNLPTERSRQ